MLELNGDRASAEQTMAAPPPPAVPEVAVARVPQVEGVTTRKVWAWHMEDESLLPREYLIPDFKKIAGVVRAMGSLANIPGVRTYEDTIHAVSGISR